MSKKNDPISQNDNDEQFWDLTDQFIGLANQLGQDEVDLGKIGAAMLYAASRFNVFAVAVSSVDKEQYAQDMDEVMEYLNKQFRHMLGGNLRDFRDNYKTYIQAPDEADKAGN